MTDITAITSIVSGIKTAIDLAKVIKESGASLEQAENKLKFAELIDALADAKLSVAELKDLIDQKDSKISELEAALVVKETLTYDGRFYRKEGDATPFCPRCWEKDHEAIHLAPEESGGNYTIIRICPECDKRYKIRNEHFQAATLIK